jgi:DNA-directed RNA polymerase specialized sigma24 family protein
MLVDDIRIRELVKRAIGRWVFDPVNREDLVQEALIHLWLIEEQFPGQQTSWYLRSCRFHVWKFMRTGRSIDSPKRAYGRVEVADADDFDGLVDRGIENHRSDTMDRVSAVEIIEKLAVKLVGKDLAILRGLADGLGAREIARQLQVSHPAVIKRRRKIAKLARHLGLDRPGLNRRFNPAMNQSGVDRRVEVATVL